MKKTKLFYLLLLSLLVLAQAVPVAASPLKGQTGPIHGTVQAITLETDPVTGITFVQVTLVDRWDGSQSVRIGRKTAEQLGLLTQDEDGKPVINEAALGMEVAIDPSDILPDNEKAPNPVGSALVAFFADIPDLEYELVMSAYESGNGFGVIAQALWLTRKLGGDAGDFLLILEARQTGDFGAFTLEDGTVPSNWGQFRKAVLEGARKGSLGIAVSHKDDDKNTGSPKPSDKNNGTKDKEKKDNRDKEKDKDNNGNRDKP